MVYIALHIPITNLFSMYCNLCFIDKGTGALRFEVFLPKVTPLPSGRSRFIIMFVCLHSLGFEYLLYMLISRDSLLGTHQISSEAS
jgi:hypothetical protein